MVITLLAVNSILPQQSRQPKDSQRRGVNVGFCVGSMRSYRHSCPYIQAWNH